MYFQKWTDYKLSWDPLKYNNITEIRLPQKILWKPDILMYNRYVYITLLLLQANSKLYVVFNIQSIDGRATTLRDQRAEKLALLRLQVANVNYWQTSSFFIRVYIVTKKNFQIAGIKSSLRKLLGKARGESEPAFITAALYQVDVIIVMAVCWSAISVLACLGPQKKGWNGWVCTVRMCHLKILDSTNLLQIYPTVLQIVCT